MKCKLLPSEKITFSTHQLLRNRLDLFYNSNTNYTAFENPSDHKICWDHILSEIIIKLERKNRSKLKVLEVGAGKTGFGRFLTDRGFRNSIEFHVQDVTKFNEIWLRGEADTVFFGDVLDCPILDRYDIIFSTYVLEHVSNPLSHLNKLWTVLLPEAHLFLFSPRYDLPGYICPSARYLPKRIQIILGFNSLLMRFASMLSKRPIFLIQTDLAAFYLPFFLDADAVHWVSFYDIKRWVINQNGCIKKLKIGTPVFLSKDWIIKSFCTLAVKISKKAGEY